MVKQIVFHIEGGRSKVDDAEFRRAFHIFFSQIVERAKQKGIGFKVKMGGPRKSTYDQFCYETRHDVTALHILLVDSEAPVVEPGKVWKHLKQRTGDGWDCPLGVDDTHCHLMVEAMEAWFFADPDALAAYYKQNFNANALSKRQDVETIPKGEHIPQLEAATKNTQKRRYDKFGHAPDIMMRLDVGKVRSRAWHCDRIFTTLEQVIANLP